jgi:hypothetical protein
MKHTFTLSHGSVLSLAQVLRPTRRRALPPGGVIIRRTLRNVTLDESIRTVACHVKKLRCKLGEKKEIADKRWLWHTLNSIINHPAFKRKLQIRISQNKFTVIFIIITVFKTHATKINVTEGKKLRSITDFVIIDYT